MPILIFISIIVLYFTYDYPEYVASHSSSDVFTLFHKTFNDTVLYPILIIIAFVTTNILRYKDDYKNGVIPVDMLILHEFFFLIFSFLMASIAYTFISSLYFTYFMIINYEKIPKLSLDNIEIVVLVVTYILIYFMPTMIAENRKHHNLLAIETTNILLGWTIIGWIASLIWASTQIKTNFFYIKSKDKVIKYPIYNIRRIHILIIYSIVAGVSIYLLSILIPNNSLEKIGLSYGVYIYGEGYSPEKKYGALNSLFSTTGTSILLIYLFRIAIDFLNKNFKKENYYKYEFIGFIIGTFHIIILSFFVVIIFSYSTLPYPIDEIKVFSIIFIPLIYLIPSYVSYKRKHRNTIAIFVTNLILGWTVIGWILSLIWSTTNAKRKFIDRL